MKHKGFILIAAIVVILAALNVDAWMVYITSTHGKPQSGVEKASDQEHQANADPDSTGSTEKKPSLEKRHEVTGASKVLRGRNPTRPRIKLFFAVHSARYNFAKRAAMRKGGLLRAIASSADFEYRFVIGKAPVNCDWSIQHVCKGFCDDVIQPCSLNDQQACIKRHSGGCRPKNMSREADLRQEQGNVQDLMVLDFEDTYYNLTRKSVLSVSYKVHCIETQQKICVATGAAHRTNQQPRFCDQN